MGTRGLVALVAALLLLAGCTSAEEPPGSAALPTPFFDVPAELQAILDASVAGDYEVVRAHLKVWNEQASRDLTDEEISVACARAETRWLGSRAGNANLTPRLRPEDATGGLVLWLEAEDSSATGWGVDNVDGVWYLQAQSDACLDLWSSPSPS